MRFFDPADETLVRHRRLPHWAQDGVVVFLTWRTHDSMPRSVLAAWRAERNRWLMARGIDPTLRGWKIRVQDLQPAELTEFHRHFTMRWHRELDAGYGACHLRRPELAQIVSGSLRHFDGERYELLDYVIMPNHVHLLATFPDKTTMLNQCESWKHFTSTRINRELHTKGRFWQQDAFDHLVRNEAQFQWLQRYIAENPRRAGLRVGEFMHWSSARDAS
ncbi:MAG TPA: transposase [Chthoniobacteraceae bacterium]|nr:transposase [Chthoniobacteraceae bacterium]